MDAFGNAVLGTVFFLLSLSGTLLMYKLWGYPYNHTMLKSSAPPGLMLVHRLIGYAYAIIYIYLMTQMVPRLWSYQVEFPARTVAHLSLGIAIGIILTVKISIVRFFKHLESTLVPFLGTLLLVCTTLLIGLSVPFALREQYLHRTALGGTAFSPENLDRVKMVLKKAGLPPAADIEDLVTVPSLKKGRDVLLSKCVQCHDLRQVLVKPRTPDNWVQVVARMSERDIFNPISEQEQYLVDAYLVAISPDLQKGVQKKMQQEEEFSKSRALAEAVVSPASGEMPMKEFDLPTTKATFEATCAQCHSLKNIERAPPGSSEEARMLVARMVENGLEAPETDLQQIIYYLTKTYGKSS